MRWFGELYVQQKKALEDEWLTFFPQHWIDYIRNNEGKTFELTKQWIKELFDFCNEMPVRDPKQETEDQFLERWLHKMQEYLDSNTVEACDVRFNFCCQEKGDVYIPSHLKSVKENRQQTGKQVALMLFATGLTRAASDNEHSQIIAGQGKKICLLNKDAYKKLRNVRDISIKELTSGVHVTLDKRTGELMRSGRAAASAGLMFAIDTKQRTYESIRLAEWKKFGMPSRCYAGRSSHDEVSKTLDKSNMKEHTLQSQFPDQKFLEDNFPHRLGRWDDLEFLVALSVKVHNDGVRRDPFRLFKIYQVSVEYMKHLYGKYCASLGVRSQPTLMDFYNYVYQRLTYHPESYVDNMLAPKNRVSGSPGYESELRQWWQSEEHRKKRKQKHDRVWEKHLADYLEFKGKEDPENIKKKSDYLPASLYSWWCNQRHNHKLCLDGGEVDTGSMTRERAAKLIAAGIVEVTNNAVVGTYEKTWDESLAAYLDHQGEKNPENTELKSKYLPAPLRNWWSNQRHYYKVYLDGGEVDTDMMTKDRADTLIAAGIVKRKYGCQMPLSLLLGHPGCPHCAPYSHLVAAEKLKRQVPSSSYHRVTSPPGHPGCPHCSPYSHLIAAGTVGRQGHPEYPHCAPYSYLTRAGDDPSQNSSSGLPPGWIQCYDSISGRPYYFQEATGQTTWDRP